MGQVFRARDTRLGREVALKVLKDELAGSDATRSRLEQEARLLASLNHPRIAALHDVLDFDGSLVLVMEVVEGETLAERLSRGSLPLKTSLKLAIRIAEALEAAHERGILHRDLKPSNIKLTPEGGVKVLDFGLAKALEPDGSSEDRVPSSLTTLPKPEEETERGVAVGTPPYMSPEQARGEPVNRRTDVWAFGCILFEMLTGGRAFPGATRSAVLTAVLEHEPDWGRLPSSTPDAVRRILKRCLHKEQRERFRDIADLKLELKDLFVEMSAGVPVAQGRTARRRWKTLTVAGVVALLAVSALVVLRRQAAPPAEIRLPRTQLTLPRDVSLSLNAESSLAISPDGRRVAFTAAPPAGSTQLYLRDRMELDARLLPGTEEAIGPFFSPDGRFVAFGARGKLKKIDLERGTVVTLTDAPSLRGGSWGEDGTILFAKGRRSGLSRVSAEGGAVEEITKLGPGEYDHRWPQILPGGGAALFEVSHEVATSTNIGSRGHDLAVADLGKGTRKTLIESAGCPKYVSGHLLFGRDGVVYAAPFDLGRLELDRPPSPVLEGVAMWSSASIVNVTSGVVHYDVARDGTLLFSPREARLPKRTLVSVDRQGRQETLAPSQRAYYYPLFSPDGSRIAVRVQTDVGAWDTFVLDIGSGAWTRVSVNGGTTTDSVWEPHPGFFTVAWMPDGERLVLDGSSSGDHGLLVARVDGSEPPQVFPTGVSAQWPAVAPDGSAVLFVVQPRPGDLDIWRATLTGNSEVEPWLATRNIERRPQFSPDGRWVAYFSDDSGREEIYVRPYAGSAVTHQVSAQGGASPLWARGDGGEIIFRSRRSLWSASVRTSPRFIAESPQRLFELPEDILGDYDVSPDGQHFVMVQNDPIELRPLDLVVVSGWVEEMKARLAAAK
jgi:serine/threonine-protein kinase